MITYIEFRFLPYKLDKLTESSDIFCDVEFDDIFIIGEYETIDLYKRVFFIVRTIYILILNYMVVTSTLVHQQFIC
jgi:hypothetical protein